MANNKQRLIWSPEAITDLDTIWDFYVGVAGQRTAEKMVREIAKICRTVEHHPLAGRTRDEIRPGLRSLASHPNVIFYRVRNEIAEIVRIFDGRRDVDTIFFPD